MSHFFAASLGWGGWRRNTLLIVLITATIVVLAALVDHRHELPWGLQRPHVKTFPAAPLANACSNRSPAGSGSAGASAGTDHAAAGEAIPNIVHYVWLLADPTVLSMPFKVFVSVYSAHVWLRPDIIYVHTDASPELWERTKASGDQWTRRVLNVPNVVPRFAVSPEVTSKGVAIDTFGAKSDFLRGDVLRTYGGVYLDVDAVPLRDLTPLRKAGFASVVGGAVALQTKHTGYVNTGVWLSQPHSSLAEIFYEAMDAFYNGVWAISVEILSDLAYRLHAIPGEVLIVHPRMFAPSSWELADQKRLFKPHRDTPPPAIHGAGGAAHQKEPFNDTCMDALAWLRTREAGASRLESWEMDFSATYVLHAFDDNIDRIWGWDGQITLQYVLARQSNYARAVYPAIWHAVEAGIVSMQEGVAI